MSGGLRCSPQELERAERLWRRVDLLVSQGQSLDIAMMLAALEEDQRARAARAERQLDEIKRLGT